MFSFSKNKQLFSELDKYLKVTEEAMTVFSEALTYLLKNSMDEHFKVMASRVSKLESEADDLRRKIELEVYQESLLPETRNDLLLILESVDRIPNGAETILNMFITQNTVIMESVRSLMLELVNISLETYNYTSAAVKDCFEKMERVQELNRLVDNNESLGDELERKMVSIIFESDTDTAEKILQKEFVKELGSLCDKCETTLDLVVICAVKRRV